jgi:hypothetical protein
VKKDLKVSKKKSSLPKKSKEQVDFIDGIIQEAQKIQRAKTIINDTLEQAWYDFFGLEPNEKKGTPKKDGSGKGKRKNKGRGGCTEEEQEKKGKGQEETEKDHTYIETDFMPFTRVNDLTFGGYFTRDGEFLYGNTIKYKDWDNIQDVYGNVDHLIAYGSKKPDSHIEGEERFIGYFDTFELVPKGEKGPYPDKDGKYIDERFNRVAVKFHPNKDLKDLTDLQGDQVVQLPVSASYDDIGKGTIQHISKLHHGAVSLNKNELDRCSTLGGSACNLSLIQDFIDVSENKASDSAEGSDKDVLDTVHSNLITINNEVYKR